MVLLVQGELVGFDRNCERVEVECCVGLSFARGISRISPQKFITWMGDPNIEVKRYYARSVLGWETQTLKSSARLSPASTWMGDPNTEVKNIKSSPVSTRMGGCHWIRLGQYLNGRPQPFCRKGGSAIQVLTGLYIA